MEPSGEAFEEFMQLREDILVLQQGAFLYEFESDGPHLKWFELDATCRAVKWKSSSDAVEWEGKIFLRNIQDLVTGETKALVSLQNSPLFRKSRQSAVAPGGIVPYVSLVTRKRTMHIAFIDGSEYGTWMRGLIFLTGITPTDYSIKQKKDKGSRHRTPSYLTRESSSSSLGSLRTGSHSMRRDDRIESRLLALENESSGGSISGGVRGLRQRGRQNAGLSHDDASLLHTLLDENRILVSTCERQARTIGELREELQMLRETLAQLQMEEDEESEYRGGHNRSYHAIEDDEDEDKDDDMESHLRGEIEVLKEALAAKDATIEGLCDIVSGGRYTWDD
eukprot:Opistho-2@43286